MRTREIVNLADGSRLGPMGDADILFDPDSGQIVALLLPAGDRGPFSRRRLIEVPWTAVRRIGPDVVIVDINALGKT